MIEDAEEAVEEIGQEVSEGDSKDEDGEITKENFSKNPTQNNNNNVKKTFNRESAKRKISIPLHMQNMEQEKVIAILILLLLLLILGQQVVDPLPVMEQIEVEDDASRKSSLASTQVTQNYLTKLIKIQICKLTNIQMCIFSGAGRQTMKTGQQ